MILRPALALLMLVLASSAWGAPPPPEPDAEDANAAKLLTDGVRVLTQEKKPAEAIPYFDRVIASYESRYSDRNIRYFSARFPTESLFYVLDAANNDKGATRVVSANWAYAHYTKGYALIELGRIADAKVALGRAVQLAPENSQILSEYGHVFEIEKAWPQALEIFRRAERAAKEFSPPDKHDAELARAWRGMGYSLIEMQRYDEAETLYRQCLDLNKDDRSALRELAYLRSLKAKAPR